MDAAHKAKLAQGRADARAVKGYLEFLEENKPRRGRRRTKDSINKRLGAIDAELAEASALARLNLLQERMDLETELDTMSQTVDGSALRAAFVEAAGRYAESKSISRAAFRQMGVDAKTLSEAGVS
ncbi:MAG: hypothetical protein KJN63_03150 [Acidimicrobiia bacterium]|nr:hypothetical protein [Acidimicrobiia bacterium]